VLQPGGAGAVDPPPTTDTVTVSGDGVVLAVPDRAEISAGVETRAPTAKAALQANAAAMADVLDALRAGGGRDVTTQTVSLSTSFDDQGTPNGFVASNIASATVVFSKAGALIDAAVALALTGAPTFDTRPVYWAGLLYLALAASVLTFSLYYPVVRRIGPAKAAYSSVIVPIIAMGFSTWLENYRWTALTVAGAVLALGGMVGALSRSRSSVAAPDAA
jgi:hypothetical protein